MSEHMNGVLESVKTERMRQDAKWGPQAHSDTNWLPILAEEFGEAAKEVCEITFRPGPLTEFCLETELIQTAAVCVAWVENIRARRTVSPEQGEEKGK